LGKAQESDKMVSLKSSPRICILGAGLSGLNAARVFVKNGIQPEIYEARNRAGGQIFTDPLGGDMGGQFIGSPECHREIYDAIDDWSMYAEGSKKDLFVEFNKNNSRVRYVYKGVEQDPTKMNRDLDFLRASIKGQFSNLDLDNFNPLQLTEEQTRIEKKSLLDWMMDTPVALSCENSIGIFQAIAVHNNGVSAHLQNLLSYFLMYHADGRDFEQAETRFIRGGASQMINLGTRYLERNSVSLNYEHECVKIEEMSDSVLVTFKTTGGFVTREFDRIVVATPPSVYPNSGKIQVGKTAIWSAEVSQEFCKDKVLNIYSDIGRVWLQDSPQNPNRRIVTFFSGGEHYEPAKENPWQMMEVLVPGIKQEALKYHTLDWPNETFSKGSYSFSRPGEFHFVQEGYAGRPLVRFASEAFSPGFVGYMNGAAQAGFRAAMQILIELRRNQLVI
jgi:monoamine oxidase